MCRVNLAVPNELYDRIFQYYKNTDARRLISPSFSYKHSQEDSMAQALRELINLGLNAVSARKDSDEI